MATRHLIFFLLQEIFHQRSVTGNGITSSNYVITESHSQIMTDMTTSGRPQVEGALDGLSDNDTKVSDISASLTLLVLTSELDILGYMRAFQNCLEKILA